MQNRKMLLYPVLFAAVLAPVFIVALLTYRPGGNCDDCNCAAAVTTAPHSHGAALVSHVQNDMQLLMNVSAAAELYRVTDGNLELCGELSGDLKHVTVDVIDAGLNPGERLPVTVELTIRNAATGDTVLEAGAPAMYAPGHGYHFGDNYALPSGATYDWTFTISPVQVLRQEGAQTLWLEPVEWSGSFTLDDEGNVAGKGQPVQPIGNFTAGGLHVSLGYQDAKALYEVETDGTTLPREPEPGALYFVVDITDHAVNYEEKLPGAAVTLTFQRGSTSFDVQAEPVISPQYGFHYGANVAVDPGEWDITVQVSGLDFLRHAGAAISLARNPVSATFTYTFEAPTLAATQ
jgi:hypothetical protein